MNLLFFPTSLKDENRHIRSLFVKLTDIVVALYTALWDCGLTNILCICTLQFQDLVHASIKPVFKTHS